MAMTATFTTFDGQIIEEHRNGTTTLLIPDTLGNVIERRTAAGTQTYTATYWPYGEVRTSTGSNPSPWGFCGIWGYFTGTGSVPLYVRARYYLAKVGRWLTVDPLWPRETAFCYTGCNPTASIDYLGLIAGALTWGALGGSAAGTAAGNAAGGGAIGIGLGPAAIVGIGLGISFSIGADMVTGGKWTDWICSWPIFYEWCYGRTVLPADKYKAPPCPPRVEAARRKPPLQRPGGCNWATYTLMKLTQDLNCNLPGCDIFDDCETLAAKRRAAFACFSARWYIHFVCYKAREKPNEKGNLGDHWGPLNGAMNKASNCTRLMQARCGPSFWD